mgnify:CR=1 FL=1
MYQADEKRYEEMKYNRCGASGLLLPAVSLGLWHNFGSNGNFDNMLDMCHTAFDHGITHFDLANNYGPVYGAAEENFGRILKKDLGVYRDELVISTKAGYDMWPGPYGNWGSKKYLVASLDQSLKRMGLDYVDIFYHHRPDPNTPLEETVRALDGIVKSGKALYVGISNYNKEQTIAAAELFKELGTPFIINQRKYSMFVRDIEKDGLKDYAAAHGIGIITFSPLAQGLLTDRYLHGIPEDSRVRTDGRFLKEAAIVEETLKKPRRNGISHRLGLLGLHVLADGHGVLVVRHVERQAPHARPPRLVALGGKDLSLKDDAAHLRVQPLHGDGLAANLLAHEQVGRAAAALIRLGRADVQAQLAQLILLGEHLLQRRARRLGDRLPALYLHFQQALCLIQRAAHDHRVMQQQPKIARRHKALEKIKKR